MDKALCEVSIIIAAHNVEGYIERAVGSALAQQEVQVEVIVVDDASTDNTVGVVSRITDPRLKIIRRTSNDGPSTTRNEGFAAATAQWIAVLDGDDAFAPDRLMRCLQCAKKLQADIVVDNLEVHREADGAHYVMFRPADWGDKPTLELATFIKGNLSFLGGVSLGYMKPVFSAAFLRQHHLGYDPEIRIGEDYMLLADALACGAVCAVEPGCGYFYTVRTDSISHRLSLEDIMRMQAGDDKLLARHKLDANALKAQKKRAFSLQEAYYFTKLVDHIKQKNGWDALKIIATHPTAALHLWQPVWIRLQRGAAHLRTPFLALPPRSKNAA